MDQGAVNATSINAFKSKLDKFRLLDILGWASSWTSPLISRPFSGTPASEAAQGEYMQEIRQVGLRVGYYSAALSRSRPRRTK